VAQQTAITYALEVLKTMGFGRAASAAALVKAKGDVERAVEALTREQERAENTGRMALRLASADADAADDLLTVLTQIAAHHSDARYRILPVAGDGPYPRALRAGDGAGEALLAEAGFQRRSGTFALTQFDARRVEVARAALAEAVASGSGAAAAERRRRERAAQEAARNARRTVAASFEASDEPTTAGVATLTFVLGGKRTTRRFDSDDCLEKAVRFLASLDPRETPTDLFLDGDADVTWRLLVVESLPVWWCDAWRLETDDRVFTDKDATKTLAALGLWPSATIRVSSDNERETGAPGASSSASSARKATRTKPTPSEMMRSVNNRFGDSSTGPSASSSEHFNVKKSVDRVPGLADLLAMGFSEPTARAALRKSQGNLQRAIDALLASSSSSSWKYI